MWETDLFLNYIYELSKIAGTASMATDLQVDLEKLQPRDVSLGDALDPEFDLRTLGGERHPGDKVIVTFRVVEPSAENSEPKVIEENRQTL